MADDALSPRPRWALAPLVPDEVVEALRLPRQWAQLLYNRGIETRDMAWDLLHASEDALHDPFLFSEMDAAVDRVMSAVSEGETIAVFGDFDTDGVTASALLYESLVALGGDAFVHLPHRVRDGHGLNAEAVKAIAEQGASLIITVDCGITSGEEVRLAKGLDMDVILTDHHAPMGTPPEAFAMVTPTESYPFPFLTGAGLAFKLVQAIHRRLETPVPAGALELASLGTVADMAPLLGENRAIATLGLERLRETERPGLLALLASAGVSRETLDHESIPFIIAPRLNAAGRMDSPDLAFGLLTEDDPSVAQELASRIELLNRERRSLTQELLDEGMRLAGPQVEAGERLLFLAGEQFNPGVSGLVAGRLAERFSRPAIVVAIDGDIARASGRSISEFHLAHALADCGERFLHFGGHPAAAGFVARAENLDAIGASLQALARERLKDATLEPTVRVDAEAAFADMPGQTMGFLGRLAPFGQENPPPTFVARGIAVTGVRRMGSEGGSTCGCSFVRTARRGRRSRSTKRGRREWTNAVGSMWCTRRRTTLSMGELGCRCVWWTCGQRSESGGRLAGAPKGVSCKGAAFQWLNGVEGFYFLAALHNRLQHLEPRKLAIGTVVSFLTLALHDYELRRKVEQRTGEMRHLGSVAKLVLGKAMVQSAVRALPSRTPPHRRRRPDQRVSTASRHCMKQSIVCSANGSPQFRLTRAAPANAQAT